MLNIINEIDNQDDVFVAKILVAVNFVMLSIMVTSANILASYSFYYYS